MRRAWATVCAAHVALRPFEATSNCIASSIRYMSSDNPIIKNRDIMYDEMRVVYTDKDSGEKSWRIMARGEALKYAKSMNLDLILGE
jgi:hypothetical protein